MDKKTVVIWRWQCNKGCCYDRIISFWRRKPILSTKMPKAWEYLHCLLVLSPFCSDISLPLPFNNQIQRQCFYSLFCFCWLGYINLNWLSIIDYTDEGLLHQTRAWFVLYFNKILKLACHINCRCFFLNIKSISVHPLLWMNIMLDDICMVFAELWATGSKRKIQNENMCFRWESKQRAALTTRLAGQLTTCS